MVSKLKEQQILQGKRKGNAPVEKLETTKPFFISETLQKAKAKKLDEEKRAKAIRDLAEGQAKAIEIESKKAYQKALKADKAKAVKTIKVMVEEFGLKATDIFKNIAVTTKADDEKSKKYYDPVSGNGWTGMGRAKAPFEAIKNNPKELAKYLNKKIVA